jgi:P27 family predicted phage terminase small subunit
LIKGNPSGRPINKREPKPAPELPSPPPELSAEALQEWKRIAPRLLRVGILTALDRTALAAYCQAYGRWIQAERIVKAEGELIVTTHHGNKIPHPALGIANRAMNDAVKFAAEFGMTPSGRSRVGVSFRDLQTDPSDHFFSP